MRGEGLLILVIILSIYVLYDFFSIKRYERLAQESKIGLGFLTNILTLSGLMNLFSLWNIQIPFIFYLSTMLVLSILMQVLSIYYGGFTYKIPFDDTDELSVILKKILWYHGHREVDPILEANETKFVFPGEKKSIEMAFHEGVISRKSHHTLKFKRWGDKATKEEILESLDEKLGQYEVALPVSSSKSFELIGAIVLLVASILYFNYEAVSPSVISVFDESSSVEVLELSDYDIVINESAVLMTFEEHYKNADAHYTKYIKFENFDDKSIKVSYGDTSKTLFVGPKSSYLYVNYEDLKNKSSWDRFKISLYELYGKKEGVFYAVEVYDQTLYAQLLQIVNRIED